MNRHCFLCEEQLNSNNTIRFEGMFFCKECWDSMHPFANVNKPKMKPKPTSKEVERLRKMVEII